MKIRNLSEGLRIISKYAPDAVVSATNDELHIAHPSTMNPTDMTLMVQLGWIYDSDNDSWLAYT